ncbi:MAG: zinc ribbon domain-containing protein [Candidatus Adiutrix sp.]|nr:zinc ribbon domain-containing protein [Candidatus Adiutrix sp.]
MPIYEYSCPACGHAFEELTRNSREKAVCPKCGSENCHKLMSASCFLSKNSAGQTTGGSAGVGGCSGCAASSCATCGK